MSNNRFFERINKQIENERPFILSSDFGKNSISARLQTNSITYKTKDFSEEGYVFAPFDLSSAVYLIPNEETEEIELNEPSTFSASFNAVYGTISHNQHKRLVSDAIKAIDGSALEKVVLARTAELNFIKMDIVQLFLSLVSAYPYAYTYCWYHPKTGFWLGASPETLLKIQDRKLKTMALAGTQEYNGSMDVQWDLKNHEEHTFVTSYLKNKLSDYISDIVISTPKTTRAGKLLHLQTTLSGTLIDAPNALSGLISSIHPTPAVCGTPKKEAMLYINKFEPIDRAFYSGFLGEINVLKNNSTVTNLVVNLRCMHLNGLNATLFAGGGITSKSDPEKEWEETEAKLRTISSVFTT